MTTSTSTTRSDATVTATPGEADRDPPIDPPERKVAAVMFPLDRAEAASLQAELGPAWAIAEGRHCEDPDLVIVRPSSVQTIVGLRHRFPTARLIAIEPFLGEPARTGGPVGRALAAGLDGYAADTKNLTSAVADRRSRPCRHRSARWRRRAGSSRRRYQEARPEALAGY